MAIGRNRRAGKEMAHRGMKLRFNGVIRETVGLRPFLPSRFAHCDARAGLVRPHRRTAKLHKWMAASDILDTETIQEELNGCNFYYFINTHFDLDRESIEGANY